MIPPNRVRVNVEAACVAILKATGMTVGVKRPNAFPNTGDFVTLFLNGGYDETVVTENANVEVESWAATKSTAFDQINAVTNALESAAFTRGLREIVETKKPGSLETGFDGWFRYTAAYQITQRTR